MFSASTWLQRFPMLCNGGMASVGGTSRNHMERMQRVLRWSFGPFKGIFHIRMDQTSNLWGKYPRTVILPRKCHIPRQEDEKEINIFFINYFESDTQISHSGDSPHVFRFQVYNTISPLRSDVAHAKMFHCEIVWLKRVFTRRYNSVG